MCELAQCARQGAASHAMAPLSAAAAVATLAALGLCSRTTGTAAPTPAAASAGRGEAATDGDGDGGGSVASAAAAVESSGGAVAGRRRSRTGRTCSTPLHCSLNGACGPSGCICDSGWRNGPAEACELLDLLPADLSAGYNHLLGHASDNGSISTWGATQQQGDDGVYHTYVGMMRRGCGINGFETNEEIVHATSASPLGPWATQGPLGQYAASAVCPHAQRDQSTGQWLIFHTGCGNHSNPASEPAPLLIDCVNGTTGPSAAPSDLRPKGAPKTCGVASDVTSLFVGASPHGPWTQQLVRVAPGSASKYINGVPWPGCDGHDNGYDHWTCNATLTPGGNPTALVLENGTTLLLFRTYYKNATMCKKLGMVLRSKAEGNGCECRPDYLAAWLSAGSS